jgi:hypothetical protein
LLLQIEEAVEVMHRYQIRNGTPVRIHGLGNHGLSIEAKQLSIVLTGPEETIK